MVFKPFTKAPNKTLENSIIIIWGERPTLIRRGCWRGRADNNSFITELALVRGPIEVNSTVWFVTTMRGNWAPK